MSTLKTNLIQDLSGNTQYTCKAWVNFNGTGTVAIRASGNVSSITDNGVGDYTVNFTTAMSDTNYCITANAGANYVGTNRLVYGVLINGTGGDGTVEQAPTSTAFRIGCADQAGIKDFKYVNIAVFR